MPYAVDNLELRRLVAPMSPEVFVAEYWQSRSILIPGPADRLPLRLDRERVLKMLEQGTGSYLLVRAGPDAKPINRRDARHAFESGMSLCVDHLETEIPDLAAYVLALQVQLNFPGSVTVASYLSPKNTGFSHTHLDGRIALTIQCQGAKQWRYAQQPFLPWPVHRPRMADDGRPVWSDMAPPWETATPHEPIQFESAVLAPGDVLCIPAGTWHSAEAVEGPSLSLRIGFEKSSTFRFLTQVLTERFESDPAWRALPGSWQDRHRDASAGLPVEVAQHLAERLDELQTFLSSLTVDSLPVERAWRRMLRCDRSVDTVEGRRASEEAAPEQAAPEQAAPKQVPLDQSDRLAVADNLPVLYSVEPGLAPDDQETVVIVRGRNEISLSGDGLSDFLGHLLRARRFIAQEAMDWGPDGERLEWDEVMPVLELLSSRGVIHRQPADPNMG